MPALNETTVSSVFAYPDHIGPEAETVIRTELIRWLGRIECGFACRWDPASRSITTARLTTRGNATAVTVISRDLEDGEVFVHNHPTGIIWPSDEDLDAAAQLGKRGCGFGIIDSEATTLFMVRYPLATCDVDLGRPIVVKESNPPRTS